MPTFRLRSLNALTRLGIACLVLVILGGLAISAAQVYFHHGKRDEKPGLSINDVKGAYGGVNLPSKLVSALEANHPPELPKDKRDALLKWLKSDKISSDWDNDDMGENAPIDIIDKNCLACHSRKTADKNPIAKTIPLDYFDDIKKIAYAKEINRVPLEILVISSHTHTLTLAPLGLVAGALVILTRWSRRVAGLSIALIGVGLLADLGGQWLARVNPEFVFFIFVGGGLYMLGMVIAMLATLAELILPESAAQ